MKRARRSIVLLGVLLTLAACSWWEMADQNKIRIINDAGCRLWILVEGDPRGSLAPGDRMTVDDVGDGRHWCEAYLDRENEDLCDGFQTENLSGGASDTWWIDDPDCDECP